MKWIGILLIIGLSSVTSQAQLATKKIITGKVAFDQDSTDWIAMVSEKDTVSVLFSMMFDKQPTQPLPPDGYYQISYGADNIQFRSTKKERSYSFYTNELPIKPARKGVQQWAIIGLSKMNPVCFPKKK